MKYKVKLWSYDILDYEEAETELNRMAGDGYELIRISMAVSYTHLKHP